MLWHTPLRYLFGSKRSKGLAKIIKIIMESLKSRVRQTLLTYLLILCLTTIILEIYKSGINLTKNHLELWWPLWGTLPLDKIIHLRCTLKSNPIKLQTEGDTYFNWYAEASKGFKMPKRTLKFHYKKLIKNERHKSYLKQRIIRQTQLLLPPLSPFI